MTPSAARRRRRGTAGAARFGALLFTLLAWVQAMPLAAQSAEERVTQARLEYRAALAAHEAARRAYDVVERQFSDALNASEAARRSGGDDALEEALARVFARSGPKKDAEDRLTEQGVAVRTARRALIDALSFRQQQLVARIDAARTPAERRDLDALLTDVSRELAQLEAEPEDQVTEPIALPRIEFDPRDGPDELRGKAELLERLAAIVDTTVADTDEQIAELVERQRTDRRARDFSAGIDRFGDRLPPVTAGPPGADRGVRPDSTVTGGRPLTLEERIQRLRDYRQELLEYRDQLQIRAAQFRRLIRSVT